MTTMAAPERDPVGEDEAPGGVPPGTRAQVLGLVLAALAPLTMFGVGVATGSPLTDAVFFVVIAAVLGAGAWAVGRFGTWSTVLGLVLTVLAGVAGFWIAFGLTAPTSPGDFVPAVLFLTGVALALVGGVRSLVARRRGRTVPTPTAGERRTRTVVVAVVALALVGSVAGNLLGRTTVDAASAAGATEVEIAGFEFTDTEHRVPGGDDATLLVRNRDGFLHDLSLPAHDLAITVAPGSEGLLDVSSLAAGTYTFYCTLHSDTSVDDPEEAGMAGTLVVE